MKDLVMRSREAVAQAIHWLGGLLRMRKNIKK